MTYAKNFIVLLDNDLEGAVTGLKAKRRIADADILRPAGLRSIHSRTAPAFQGVVANSRLIIIGHGDPNRADRLSGRGQLTPALLAVFVARWLGGTKIDRISLHICFAGGRRDGQGVTSEDFGNYAISPHTSFGHAFASLCGEIAESVSARTGEVGGVHVRVEQRPVSGFKRKVGDHDQNNFRYRETGDKIIYSTGNNVITSVFDYGPKTRAAAQHN